MIVQFDVHGIPAPQGSLVRTRYGVRPDNPNTKPWKGAVASEAHAAMHARRLDDRTGREGAAA